MHIVGVLVCLAGYGLGRALVRRLLAVPGVRPLSGVADPSYFQAPRARRLAWRLGGPAGAYALCAVLTFVAARVSGEIVPTTTVSVPAGPAAEAGLLTGDRIVSIDGARIERWEQVKAALAAAGPNRALAVAVERAGAERAFTVTTSARGTLGVVTRNQRVPRPIGQALAQAAGAPVTTLVVYVRELSTSLGGRAGTETMMGPVAIAHEVSSSGGSPANGWLVALLLVLAVPAAGTWPFTLVAELVLRPRAPRAAALPAPRV